MRMHPSVQQTRIGCQAVTDNNKRTASSDICIAPQTWTGSEEGPSLFLSAPAPVTTIRLRRY